MSASPPPFYPKSFASIQRHTGCTIAPQMTHLRISRYCRVRGGPGTGVLLGAGECLPLTGGGTAVKGLEGGPHIGARVGAQVSVCTVFSAFCQMGDLEGQTGEQCESAGWGAEPRRAHTRAPAPESWGRGGDRPNLRSPCAHPSPCYRPPPGLAQPQGAGRGDGGPRSPACRAHSLPGAADKRGQRAAVCRALCRVQTGASTGLTAHKAECLNSWAPDTVICI